MSTTTNYGKRERQKRLRRWKQKTKRIQRRERDRLAVLKQSSQRPVKVTKRC